MLSVWTEILPLFVVKWLARRYCGVVQYSAMETEREFVIARPDVLVKIKNPDGTKEKK